MKNDIQTPELDKMAECRERSQAQGEFIHWLRDVHGIALCKPHEHDESCYSGKGFRICQMLDGQMTPCHFNLENMLAEFHEIDLDKVEQERRAILDAIRH